MKTYRIILLNWLVLQNTILMLKIQLWNMLFVTDIVRVIQITWWLIKWRHFPRYWPFVRRNHRSPGNSPHKGRWRGVLMFSLICAWINRWVNNGEAGDLRHHRAHYDVIVMMSSDVTRMYVLLLGWRQIRIDWCNGLVPQRQTISLILFIDGMNINNV